MERGWWFGWIRRSLSAGSSCLMGLILLFVWSGGLYAAIPTYEGAAMRLGRGNGPVDWAPDGRYMAAAQQEFIRIYDMWDGSLVREIDGRGAHVRQAVYSPADGMLFSIGDDNTLRKWNPETGEELARTTVPERCMYLSINTSGSLLATLNVSNRLTLYHSDTLQQIWDCPVTGLTNYLYHHGPVFSPGSKYLLIDSTKFLLNVSDGSAAPNQVATACYGFGPSDEELLSCYAPGSAYLEQRIGICDRTTGNILWQQENNLYSGLYDAIYLFSPRYKLMASIQTESSPYHFTYTLRLYDYPSTQTRTLVTLPGRAVVTQIALTPDGKMLQCFTENGELYTYSTTDGRLLRQQPYGEPSNINSYIGWTTDRARFYALDGDGLLHVYSTQTGQLEWQGNLAARFSHQYAFSWEFLGAAKTHDDILYAISSTGYLWRFDLKTLDSPTSLSLAPYSPFTMAMAPSEKQLAIGYLHAPTNAFGVLLINPDEPQNRITLSNLNAIRLLYSNDEELLINHRPGGYNTTKISRYNLATDKIEDIVTINDDSEDYFTIFAFSGNRRKLFVRNFKRLIVYDITTPQWNIVAEQYFWPGIDYFAFRYPVATPLPTGEMIAVTATPAYDLPETIDFNEIFIVNSQAQILEQYNDSRTAYTGSVAISPDGSQVATATYDGIYIFNLHRLSAEAAWDCYE